jgi:hypothetical protein
LRLPGFAATVALAWNKHVAITGAIHRVHIKLLRTAKALKKWQRERVGILHQLINLAKEVIFQLDVTEENKTLSIEERELHRRLKSNYLGLLSLQKVKLRQRALMSQRTSWETLRGRYDEHNSKFFLSYETKVKSSRRKKSLPKVVASRRQ